MHSLYLVFSKYKNSEKINNDLIEQWFSNQWFFSTWKSDWFVIWWRWTWILSDIQWIDIEKKNNFNLNWSKDDHQLITEDLFNKLKDQYPDAECLLYSNDIQYPDDNYIDKEKELSDIIFDEIKWMYITIIDYHS